MYVYTKNNELHYITANVSSDTYTINITTLSHDTCYVFVVRGYTINGYGLWNGLANVTLDILMETTGIERIVCVYAFSSTTSPIEDNSIGVIGGAIGAVVLIVLIIVVIVIVLCIR